MICSSGEIQSTWRKFTAEEMRPIIHLKKEQRMKLKTVMKRSAVTLFALSVFAGVNFGGKAEAIEIGSGDLALVLYGNSTEYYQNLGAGNTLLAPGAINTFTIDGSTLTNVGGANPVKWALVSFSFDNDGNATTLHSTLNPIAPSQLGAVQINFGWDATAIFSGLNGGDGLSQQFLPAGDQFSFSNLVDGAGNGSLAGAFPVSTTGGFGSTLSLIEGDYTTNVIRTVGSAGLSSPAGSALLTVTALPAPVPLPAAVILFGTGLLGLVGLGRRKLIAA
jgi:hypothetical protein